MNFLFVGGVFGGGGLGQEEVVSKFDPGGRGLQWLADLLIFVEGGVFFVLKRDGVIVLRVECD